MRPQNKVALENGLEEAISHFKAIKMHLREYKKTCKEMCIEPTIKGFERTIDTTLEHLYDVFNDLEAAKEGAEDEQGHIS